MTSILAIEKKICLESQYLTKNLKFEILNKIKSNIENDCSNEYGYVLKIIENKDINKTIKTTTNPPIIKALENVKPCLINFALSRSILLIYIIIIFYIIYMLYKIFFI